MSVLALFFVLPAEKASELASFSTPRDVPVTKKFLMFSWTGKTQHTFWDYLRANSREGMDFPFSGRVVLEFERYLTDQGTPSLAELGHQFLTASVAAADDRWPVVVFDHATAIDAAGRLNIIRSPTQQDITRLVIAHYEEEDPAEWLNYFVMTRDHLVGWLRSVGPSDVGVLTIG